MRISSRRTPARRQQFTRARTWKTRTRHDKHCHSGPTVLSRRLHRTVRGHRHKRNLSVGLKNSDSAAQSTVQCAPHGCHLRQFVGKIRACVAPRACGTRHNAWQWQRWPLRCNWLYHLWPRQFTTNRDLVRSSSTDRFSSPISSRRCLLRWASSRSARMQLRHLRRSLKTAFNIVMLLSDCIRQPLPELTYGSQSGTLRYGQACFRTFEEDPKPFRGRRCHRPRLR